MTAWRDDVDAAVARVLGGPPELTIAAGGPPRVADAAGRVATRAVVDFLETALAGPERAALLASTRRILAPGARVAIVDHNRPRRLAAAVAALVGAPHVPGFGPSVRWRRLAHPAAREARDAGLVFAALRFAVGERVQVVLATEPAGDD